METQTEILATGARIGAKTAPEPATIETPEALFLAAVQAINKRYQAGTLSHVQAKHPALYDRIGRAFDLLNYIWGGLVPGGGLDHFKRSLRTWYKLNLEAIQIYEDLKNDR